MNFSNKRNEVLLKGLIMIIGGCIGLNILNGEYIALNNTIVVSTSLSRLFFFSLLISGLASFLVAVFFTHSKKNILIYANSTEFDLKSYFIRSLILDLVLIIISSITLEHIHDLVGKKYIIENSYKSLLLALPITLLSYWWLLRSKKNIERPGDRNA